MKKATWTYVFVGKNEICGPTNARTGRRNVYGLYYKAPSRATAEAWARHCEDGSAHTIVAVGGKRVMRQYNLGASVKEFEEHLNICPKIFLGKSGEFDLL